MYHIHKIAKEAADNYQSYYLKNIHCNVNVTKDKKNLAKKRKKNGQTPIMNTSKLKRFLNVLIAIIQMKKVRLDI